MLTIGRLGVLSGVEPKTLRYYDRVGLVPPRARSGGGYRLYGEEAVTRLEFIRRAKALGMSLADIGRTLAVRDEGAAPCRHVLDLVSVTLRPSKHRWSSSRRCVPTWSGFAGSCNAVSPRTRRPLRTARASTSSGRSESRRERVGVVDRPAEKPVPTESFDLVILESGSTAFAAAIRAAELGKTAAMTESRVLGGICVNRSTVRRRRIPPQG